MVQLEEVETNAGQISLAPDVTIKVIGVGGGGGNALNKMISDGIEGVEYIAVNTDAMALNTSKSVCKVQIGQKLTGGRGAGAKPEIGEESAKENKDELLAAIKDANMVFVTAGMGGGTGTGAAPVVASLAQETGALTVGVVTKPFNFEGKKKMLKAEQGIEELSKNVDALIVISNQKLLELDEAQLPAMEGFGLSDAVLMTAVKSVAELVTVEGHMNVDFADVETTLRGAGIAHMALGIGSGRNKVQDAFNQIVASPLIETSITGATRLLINITASPEVTMAEVGQLSERIQSAASADVDLIFGYTTDTNLSDTISVTVIAAGFDEPNVVNVDNKLMDLASKEFASVRGTNSYNPNYAAAPQTTYQQPQQPQMHQSTSTISSLDDDLMNFFK